MNKLLNQFVVLLFLCTVNPLFAQEREYELTSNPKLHAKANAVLSVEKISAINKKLTLFLKDTQSIGLPFIDDFSSNKFTSYKIEDYDVSAISNAVRYSFKANGITLDSLKYITDTAYTYTYNPLTNAYDSTAVLPPNFVINVYDNLITPTIPTSTFNAWLPYFKDIYDTLADTVLYTIQPVTDTIRYLEIDSITYVNTHIFPTTTLWYENEVFINSTYPVNPPSIGVATFEGLDSTGYPYNFNNPVAYGLADKLTSKYLDLGIPLGVNDSIVLSFFYQPKGLGNTPEATDSLILDFKAANGSWGHVWSVPGRNLAPDTIFKKVDIRIKGTDYLYNGFQFRFKNYATLSGNVDHWHLDYVRLKKITTPNDLLIHDIAFVYPPEALINGFYSMPYSQYDTTRMKTFVNNTIVNLDTVPLNYGFPIYTVKDQNLNTIATYDPQVTNNILPSYTPKSNPGGNFKFDRAAHPIVNFKYNNNLTECMEFTVKHERIGTPDEISTNDKISQVQYLTNYYAYDDASAESAFGVVTAGAQVALKFTLNHPDSLSAVYIYFNPAVENGGNKSFRFVVWDELGGLPGNVIYQSSVNYTPTYWHTIDGFSKYEMDSLIPLSGTFYMGWYQFTANELNVGLDKKNNNNDKLFYNLGSGWLPSIISGSLMLHPVFGECANLYIGTNDKFNKAQDELEIFPNPANDKIQFKVSEDFTALVHIFDFTGKLILSVTQSTTQSIDISNLSEGIYFVRIENNTLNKITNKKMVVIK